MLLLFKRKPVPAAAFSAPLDPPVPPGWIRPESAATLLATPRRSRLLEHIWQRTCLSRAQFTKLYQAPLERYAELVQQLPASEAHHHAYPGGMLDHGLEIVAYALKLRQSHLLPTGMTPEAQSAQSEAWTAATAYAALLHDIGKIAVDLHVEYADGAVWHPWHGPLRRPYRFRYRKGRAYRLHSAATGLLYHQVLDPAVLDWLSAFPELWSALLYVLAGQYEHAGALGEIVVRADQASVAQALGGDPGKATTAPRHALQRKLLDGLRYLLREELKLNQLQASDAWLTQDALWLVSKTVSDKLRAHLLSQGVEGIPASNAAVFDVLQDHGIALQTPEGKAIWRGTVRSDAGWSNTFTFLRVAPSLIWDAGERPEPFAGTVLGEGAEAPCADMQTTVTASAPAATTDGRVVSGEVAAGLGEPDSIGDLLDVLAGSESSAPEDAALLIHQLATPAIDARQAPGSSAPSSMHSEREGALSGKHFMAWLRLGVQSRRLILNDAKALVHTVADTVYLVSPGVFQRFAQEHPQVAALAARDKLSDWQWVQRRFEKLQIHRKQASGLNIWTCEVQGPRKTRRLHGYLLQEPGQILPQVAANNPYLKLVAENPATPG